MNFLKSIVKNILRFLVKFRLHNLNLNKAQGIYWANIFKKYPAIFPYGFEKTWTKLPAGFMLELGVVDHIERHLFIDNRWDLHIEELLQKLLNKGDKFLDVGANIGYYSLLASIIVGKEGYIIAVEPSLRILSRLTRHLHYNHASNISVISLAASNFNSIEKLYLANESNTGGSSISRSHLHDNFESIITAPLNQSLSQINFIPRLIKIDVEGFELFALQGMDSILTGNNYVICEMTETILKQHGHSCSDIIQFMENKGYSALRIHIESTCTLSPLKYNMTLPIYQFDAIFIPKGTEQIMKDLGYNIVH